MDFRRTTVAEIAQQVAARAMSAREIVQAALDRIDRYDAEIGAFVAVEGESALAEADAIDARIAGGEDVGALAGVPLAVKDLEDAAGFVTTKGSAAYADGEPAASDSPLVERLRAAGCVVVGKTNTPEFGWKADTVNEVFGATHNPWSLERSAGGSSGGSAAALAAGLVPLATGSDGGGSIRIPASATGLTGFKPSLGRVPMGGREPPGWPMLSTRGVMTRRIRDAALALDSVVGPEPTDLVSLPLPEGSWSRSVEGLNPPRKVAWAPTLGYGKVDSEVLAVCESAMSATRGAGDRGRHGRRAVRRRPGAGLAGAGRCVIAAIAGQVPSRRRRVEPHRSRARRARRVGPHVRRSRPGDRGARRLPHAQPGPRGPVPRGLVAVVADGCRPAPRASANRAPSTASPTRNWLAYTYPFNMTRSPAGSVCAGFTADGMPVGLQVVGPQHGDVVVLRALALLEDVLALDAVAPVGGD